MSLTIGRQKCSADSYKLHLKKSTFQNLNPPKSSRCWFLNWKKLHKQIKSNFSIYRVTAGWRLANLVTWNQMDLEDKRTQAAPKLKDKWPYLIFVTHIFFPFIAFCRFIEKTSQHDIGRQIGIRISGRNIQFFRVSPKVITCKNN